MAEGWLNKLWDRIDYCPDSGALTWRAKAPISKENIRWNSRYARKPALSAENDRGYLTGRFEGRSVLAHRAAWFLSNGEWPTAEVDHINGNKTDNRAQNLRLASREMNCRNAFQRIDNTSGCVGVDRVGDRWRARIGGGANREELGTFSTFSAAVHARKAAEKRLGYSERHGAKHG